jgi:hypothetical protein
MVAVNPSGPPANQGIGPDGAAFVDSAADFPSVMPTIVPSAALPPPTFTPAAINPFTIADGAGMPCNVAILIELRALTALMQMWMGASAPDMTQLRADAAWDINPNTGVM